MAEMPVSVDFFVTYLESLRDREDRGALAALRRGLGKPPGTVADMHPLVVPRLPRNAYRTDEDLYYLVASLFAYHSQPGGKGTFGRTVRRVSESADTGRESIEQRFVALLDCHPDDLPHHLRQAVSLAKSKDVPIDYRRLLTDLRYWGHPDRFVQRNWARDYWASVPQESEENEED